MRTPKISRPLILRAAVDLVDSSGLHALTMRRLGQLLDVEAMSLYRYFPSKSHLLDGIHEAILAEMVVPPPSRSWTRDLRSMSHAFWQVLQAHPRAVPLFASRPAVTTASLAHVESALEALHRAGFSGDNVVCAFQLLFSFVIGHALSHIEVEPVDGTVDVPYAALPRDRFPRLTGLSTTIARHDLDDGFGFGLDVLLIGLKAKARKLRKNSRG